jgi:hypothetical protein
MKSKNTVNYRLSPYTKISMKWAKHLNVRYGTMELIGENKGKTLKTGL